MTGTHIKSGGQVSCEYSDGVMPATTTPNSRVFTIDRVESGNIS